MDSDETFSDAGIRMHRGARGPYRDTAECETRLHKHIRRDDPSRRKRHVISRRVATDEDHPVVLLHDETESLPSNA